MERKTKEILFGAAIIISLVGIFIPYILNGQLRLVEAKTTIPASPVWPEKQKWVEPPQEMTDFKNQPLTPHQPNTFADKPKTWVITAGVFDSSQEAEKWVKTLQDKNFPAYLKKEASAKSIPKYGVFIGPKLQKNEALNMIKQLEQDKIHSELKPYHPNMAFE
jgi:cell division septation protein DedD